MVDCAEPACTVSEQVSDCACRVYAVVVTHNGAALVDRCLQSLRCSSVPIHVIVVDNASQDETVGVLRRYGEARVIELDKNRGFGCANNVGISCALDSGATHILLINQDAWVSEAMLQEMLAVIAESEDVGIASPMHFAGIGGGLDPNFQRYLSGSGLLVDALQGNTRALYDVPFVNAALWLVTRRCLDTVGGFDPLFFMYREDDDYCRRTLSYGWRIVVVPDATGYHDRQSGQGAAPGRLQALLLRAKRLEGDLLFGLKNQRESVLRLVILSVGDSLHMAWRFCAYLDKHGLVACLIALLMLILHFPAIVRHRRLSGVAARHWIDSSRACQGAIT